ncbi:hypothetical protein G4D82_01845 [Flavobacterium sp. CYK-4]|uniref:DUF6029 family protein n=1 Tax=Flavobacterium lotistagni TaxID=2709660 RepID=UPI0014090DD1|nr:DUF6029 family protein [Flavobacterium lotistagni]NHM05951.1 hypothetical protein [Flavobacterium lotistagni]
MKNSILVLAVFFGIYSHSQEVKPKDKIQFYGGFESNSQWYLNDKPLGVDHPEVPLRSNNYLFLNTKFKNWTAGIQAESYEDQALLNYNPKYDKTDVATYFIQYKNEKIDITGGYFYEQFGSGLLYRSWEDRALGINNALRGARVIFKPAPFFTIKGIYGRQRTGFDISEGEIYGTDAEIVLSDLFHFETTEWSLGFTYVGREEKSAIVNPKYNSLTSGYAARVDFNHQGFYFSSEYNIKSKDAIVEVKEQIAHDFIKPGSALLVNMGYSTKGFGLDGTFRRLENMGFFSERNAKGNAFNDRIMNFIPSLTKQHHYNLANIYVYQSQPNVLLSDESLLKTGEIGGQIDVFYNFKKQTAFGGKYGTKVAVNISNWNALGGKFYLPNKDYQTDFLGFGRKYFSDYNIEITKKISPKWQTAFSYINQYYNKKLIEETFDVVNTNILGAEATYKFTDNKSIRIVSEHMWADTDKKNWTASTIEFNLNSKYSFFIADMYNYGNDDPELRNHYYNVGGAFRQKSTRIALNYGRQRGGLVCVGGVCRFVPESSGISLSLNTTF